MKKILIIDSDFEMAEKLCAAFTGAETCATMASATARLEKDRYQVIIMDPELPDGNGLDLIYELELGLYESEDAAVILIVANDKNYDIRLPGGQGIADYITKPFNPTVLKAKVWSQFQRREKDFALKASRRFEAIGAGTMSSIVGEHRVVIDDYIFDFDLGEYYLRGQTVRLNRLEQCLLRNLVENKGIVLGRKALLDKLVSESKIRVDETMLAKMVKSLIERLEAHRYLKTVYGIGYIWGDAEEKKS